VPEDPEDPDEPDDPDDPDEPDDPEDAPPEEVPPDEHATAEAKSKASREEARPAFFMGFLRVTSAQDSERASALRHRPVRPG
jgi:hypothetical protein